MRTIIQQAPLGVFLVMVAVPLAMAVVAVIAGLYARRQASIVKTTKSTPIGEAESGYRTFEGRAEAIAGETVVAPLTDTECVWYSAKVEEWRRVTNGPRRSDWWTVREVTSSAPLLVRDATGACVVRVFGADVTPTDKSRWKGATLEPEDRNPPRLAMTDSTEGMVQVAGGPNSGFRYTETRIYAGDPLTVTGLFETHQLAGADADLDDDEVVIAPARKALHGWDEADVERHATLTRLARK